MAVELCCQPDGSVLWNYYLKWLLALHLQTTYSGYPERLWALSNVFSHSCWLAEKTMTLR